VATHTLIFAGGGSGGHIFPGLAIAHAARAMAESRTTPPPTCLFVPSDRPLDARILDDAGERFSPSPAKPIIMRPRGIARFLASWGPAIRHARALLRDAKKQGPVHVVAMGGFVAAPFAQAARVERVSVTMVNLDAVPGKANRWIAPRSSRVFSAALVDQRHRPRSGPTWTFVPPIVRPSATHRGTPAECRAKLGLDPARPVLMITGGSQGLRSLNDFAVAFATDALGKVLRDQHWQVLHQTGRNLDDTVRAAYQLARIDAIVVPFTQDIGLWWGSADLCLCTAGAGNVAESWQSSTPALMLPYPHHRDQHQRLNARALERTPKGPGVVVGTDLIDPLANLRENGAALAELLQESKRRVELRTALASLGPADGAERIARALLDDIAPSPT
jgi:UDP-N-acetylglucosamine--N-acetylmuramyl-(pentapeptide) pyrophosphoryl-undecaprenol N-acetylglucosamine transferase